MTSFTVIGNTGSGNVFTQPIVVAAQVNLSLPKERGPYYKKFLRSTSSPDKAHTRYMFQLLVESDEKNSVGNGDLILLFCSMHSSPEVLKAVNVYVQNGQPLAAISWFKIVRTICDQIVSDADRVLAVKKMVPMYLRASPSDHLWAPTVTVLKKFQTDDGKTNALKELWPLMCLYQTNHADIAECFDDCALAMDLMRTGFVADKASDPVRLPFSMAALVGGVEKTDVQDMQCVLCWENKKTVAFRPCKHVVCCIICAKKLAAPLLCPTCRGPIEDAESMFI